MADKIYQTEGGSEVGSSLKPMSEGYYLMTAEDILVPGNKSLADYINEGGGGGGGTGDTPAVDYTTVWKINDNPDCSSLPHSYAERIQVTFISGGKTHYGIRGDTGQIFYYKSDGDVRCVYDFGWQDEGFYQTITFDEKITDIRLYTWLKQNATLLSGTAEEPEQTVWKMNENLDLTGLPTNSKTMFNVSFISNGNSYKGIHTGSSYVSLYYYSYASIAVYDYGVWAKNLFGDEPYRTIIIQGKITDVRLYAWLKKNATLLGGTAEPPVQYAYDELLETENKTVVGAINEINSNGGGSGGGATSTSSTMPTIRFVGLRGNNYLSNLDGEEQSVEFTVEVTNELLQVGDTLQLCGMRTFNASPKNKVTKRKLRRFVEHEITEEDLNNRVLTLVVHPTKNAFAFLGHNNRQGGGTCNYFFRIRRPVGDMQNNDSGMTVNAKFSNVVPVTMLNIVTSTQEDEEGNIFKELKINVI